jgi:DNA-binding response OmpR family regulator
MMNHKVLVVEDEEDLRDLVRLYLEKHDFQVSTAGTGQEAMELFRTFRPDLVVLDIELPDADGTEICRTIRETSDVPLFFVTCRRDTEDIYSGLAIGADDYLTKPFDPAELVARIHGHLRKRMVFKSIERNKDRYWKSGKIEVDLHEMEVRVEGRKVPLYSKEMQLLHFFIENPNRVFSMDEIFERVWGLDSESETKTVYVHISNLRRKLEGDPDNPELIRTVRGIGYKFAME